MYGTPQKDTGDDSFENQPETPGPVRAKVNHLTKQVSELVGKEHAAMVGTLTPISPSYWLTYPRDDIKLRPLRWRTRSLRRRLNSLVRKRRSTRCGQHW